MEKFFGSARVEGSRDSALTDLMTTVCVIMKISAKRKMSAVESRIKENAFLDLACCLRTLLFYLLF